MGKISSGRLLAKALKQEGIEVVFTLCAGQIMNILHGCADEGIEIIDVRHEGTTTHAAEAYARATGKMAAAIVMCGPATTNASTGLYDTSVTGTPMLLISGSTEVFNNETGHMQDCNTLEVMSNLTKWARKCYQPERVGEYVSLAVRQAYSGTPGPVYLEIPTDISCVMLEEDEVSVAQHTRVTDLGCGNIESVKKAAEMLVKAEKPAIAIGNSARYHTEDKEAVLELVKYLGIPTHVQMVSRGVFASEKEEELFIMDVNCFTKADVILELSVENDYMMGKGKPHAVNKDAYVIQVNTDTNKIGYNLNAHLGIAGGVGSVARQILNEVKTLTEKKENTEWINEATELRNKALSPYVFGMKQEGSPIHPARLAKEVLTFMEKHEEDFTVVTDGGDCRQWLNNSLTITRPGQFLSIGPLGAIGTGTPSVLGTWVAEKKPIIYLTGDGSFGYYPMELDTLNRIGAQVICIICNDSGWGMVKTFDSVQNKAGVDRHGLVACDLAEFARYEKLAGVWDGVGVMVEDIEEVIPAMEKILASGKPGIINVKTDPKAMSPRVRGFIEAISAYI